MSEAPLRRRPPPPAAGPRPARRPSPVPGAVPPSSSWTEAKVRAVLEAYGSFVQNAARKHGLDPSEVASLLRDHQCDPDPGG